MDRAISKNLVFKGWKKSKSVFSLISTIVVCCFICYKRLVHISALFTSTTMFLTNYSSGNIKTNSIQPVSACLAFFEAIWHFFTSGLAFFVHLDLVNTAVNVLHLSIESIMRNSRWMSFDLHNNYPCWRDLWW